MNTIGALAKTVRQVTEVLGQTKVVFEERGFLLHETEARAGGADTLAVSVGCASSASPGDLSAIPWDNRRCG